MLHIILVPRWRRSTERVTTSESSRAECHRETKSALSLSPSVSAEASCRNWHSLFYFIIFSNYYYCPPPVNKPTPTTGSAAVLSHSFVASICELVITGVLAAKKKKIHLISPPPPLPLPYIYIWTSGMFASCLRLWMFKKRKKLWGGRIFSFWGLCVSAW